jgi:SAM-dependent methyltransferase
MSIAEEVRRFWDEDAAVYDRVPNHHPTDPAQLAAWTEAVASLLPAAPSRVLDCGAGTGFLSLIAARCGHRVTAMDISPGMLRRLEDKASAAGLEVEVVEGSADRLPSGREFDAVIERHLLWTLPDPAEALRQWRGAAPAGRLILFEGAWAAADPLRQFRAAAGRISRWVQMGSRAGAGGHGTEAGPRGGHHAEYPAEIKDVLPLGRGATPRQLVEVVEQAGWPLPRLRRLGDIEWAMTLDRPLIERWIGPAPRYAVVAGS